MIDDKYNIVWVVALARAKAEAKAKERAYEEFSAKIGTLWKPSN